MDQVTYFLGCLLLESFRTQQAQLSTQHNKLQQGASPVAALYQSSVALFLRPACIILTSVVLLVDLCFGIILTSLNPFRVSVHSRPR